MVGLSPADPRSRDAQWLCFFSCVGLPLFIMCAIRTLCTGSVYAFCASRNFISGPSSVPPTPSARAKPVPVLAGVSGYTFECWYLQIDCLKAYSRPLLMPPMPMLASLGTFHFRALRTAPANQVFRLRKDRSPECGAAPDIHRGR